MKFFPVFLCFFQAIPSIVFAQDQDENIDPVAVYIMDHMSDIIGELTSCSYRLSTETDENHYQHGLIKHFGTHEVFMVGPDKMLVNTRNQHGHRGYWYDGDTLAYYSYTENNYGMIDAPANIISTIDSLYQTYDIEFPAADFFYPTFTDDMLDNFSKIIYLGNKIVEGKNCFHILASNEDMNIQLWVTDDALNLPYKFVITYKDQEPALQYQATFSNWEINPDLPTAIFEFIPPEGAREITIAPKPNLVE
jgi:hypothetical protein